jgi:hypothetical protein
MLKIKWVRRIKKDEVFERLKEEILILIFKKNTGCFKMHYGITKINDTEKVGHLYTEPVQVEETIKTFFSPPEGCFSS